MEAIFNNNSLLLIKLILRIISVLTGNNPIICIKQVFRLLGNLVLFSLIPSILLNYRVVMNQSQDCHVRLCQLCTTQRHPVEEVNGPKIWLTFPATGHVQWRGDLVSPHQGTCGTNLSREYRFVPKIKICPKGVPFLTPPSRRCLFKNMKQCFAAAGLWLAPRRKANCVHLFSTPH